MSYEYKYIKYKNKYLELKNKLMIGGKNEEDFSKEGLDPEWWKSFKCIDKETIKKIDPKIIKMIDKMAKEEIDNLKIINLDDICGLVLRVYERGASGRGASGRGASERGVSERGNKKIEPVIFIPKRINKYMASTRECDPRGRPCPMFGIDFLYGEYYEKKYGDITKNKLRDLILDFNTDKKSVKVAFTDNYSKNKKNYFEIALPIKFLDFLDKLFDHFDKVNLLGYPDNGGIDHIHYNQNDDIYLVDTWS